MADLHIAPSQLKGQLTIPPSKSHTLRAILFAALAKGTSTIHNFLPSPDTTAMIEAVRMLGAEVVVQDSLTIRGVAGKPKPAENTIQCGNSGQVLRFVGAIAALIPHSTTLTGDHSIRHNRPVKPLLDGLTQLGAFAISNRGDLSIKGPLLHESATIDGQDSQPVSGLLIAGAFAPHPIELHVTNPGEKPWIDLTLDWFKRLAIPYQMRDHTFYRTEGLAAVDCFTYTVPGDFSTAAFPIAAALITGSELTLHNLDLNDVQGDKALIPILERMGARFTFGDKTLTIHKSDCLRGIRIDINDCIDALPILAVIGCFATGVTEIFNGAIARKKESDRIAAIAAELTKMGARIEERPDGLLIQHSPLSGAALNAHGDHRIALSLSVAALAVQNGSTISDVTCIQKTYPRFISDFRSIGANLA